MKDTNHTSVNCIHQAFEAQVKETPFALAATFEGQSLTYRELNRRANQLAHYLRKLHVGPEVLVGIYVNRSLDTVIGILGILKAGGAYVPLDPAFPRERLRFMVEDAKVAVFVTQERIAEQLGQLDAILVKLDSDSKLIAQERDDDLVATASPDNLAYVIYTSGSTGQPKGVQIIHRALTNFLCSMRKEPGLSADDILLSVTTLSFDIAGLELYLPLICGAGVAITGREVAGDGRLLKELIRSTGTTVMQATPATWRILTDAGWEGSPRLKLLCGGEAMSRDLANDLLARCGELWNMYGPTETTIWSSLSKIETYANPITIGRAIANTKLYVLDETFNPVSAGATGELYIGGLGLARGYRNRPELTAERFIADPFATPPGARMYKTGDLARFLTDGTVEFLGRADNQVKLRGFRIELGEIETALAQHPEVAQAVAIVREDQPGEKRLVAYLVFVPGSKPNISELLCVAKAKLPDYMVPAAFVVLDRMPLTANKKIDRLSLPAPDLTRPDLKEEFVAPRSPAEDTLAGIWAKVLYLDRVGVNDNFFELGGHSLLATKVISRVRDTFQVELPLTDIFESSTVAELAGVIERAGREDRSLPDFSIKPVPRAGNLPLSFPQERVWFLQRLFPDTLAYNFQSTLRFKGSLDIAAVEKSLTEIVRRHEIYRTTFPAVDGRPMQVIHESGVVKVPVIDLEPLPENERAEAAEKQIRAELQKAFEVTKLPLIRWVLWRLGEDEHILLHIEHHLLHDGWSFNVFLDEFLKLYRAFAAGEPSPLPDLPVQFADFAVWQQQWMQGEVASDQLDFWREKLAASPRVLELPADRQRPAVQSFRGASKRIEWPLELCEALRKLSREQGVTLFMTLLAALEVLLQRLTHQDEFCVGSGIANRRWPETENMIGMLVNTIALRADLSGNPTFPELVGRVRKATLEASTHQDLPFDKLVDALQRHRDLSRNPLFQVMFNFHDAPLPELTLPGLKIDLVEVVSNLSAKFDLNVIVIPRSEQRVGSGTKTGASGITLIWEYSTDLFDEETILRFESHYRKLLESVVAQPGQRVADLSLLTEAERRKLLTDWKGSRTDFPKDACIHELFAQQAERTPDATAVVFEDYELSYGELNCRANQLGHYLKQRGVGPDVLVGICVERSIEMLVGLLGILKAGGAYVPLDPCYPAERLALMLQDARVSVLVTQEKFREKFSKHVARLICLDSAWPEIAKESRENPATTATAENLAYVIYTSGSTGKPKGVCVPHRGPVRLVSNTNFANFDADQIFLQFAPISFDASTFEVWGSLLNGARLVVMPPGLPSLGELGAVLQRHKVTTLWLTAGLFQQMVDAQLESLRGLRQLLAGGDVLSAAHVEKVTRELKGCQLINGYGPTENTTFTCCYRAKPDERLLRSVPIGHPISNTEVYILDGRLEPTPVGIVGSLYIGGDGLARGYLNDPELTAEKFIPHPFNDQPGARMYETGDQARFLPDGTVEFLGRTDNQVKIRGYRIELGEIEAALGRYPGVDECAVLARGDGSVDKRLVAYVVTQNEQAPEANGLRAFLQTQLPDYMVPAQFVSLSEMPLTPNGKIDRRALPEPDSSRIDLKERFVSPRTPVEQRLSEIWAPLLKLDQVGVHDNFFKLGGHSLLATQVISRVLDAFHIELPLSSIFEKPTIAGLSELVCEAQKRGSEANLPALRSLPREGRHTRVH